MSRTRYCTPNFLHFEPREPNLLPHRVSKVANARADLTAVTKRRLELWLEGWRHRLQIIKKRNWITTKYDKILNSKLSLEQQKAVRQWSVACRFLVLCLGQIFKMHVTSITWSESDTNYKWLHLGKNRLFFNQSAIFLCRKDHMMLSESTLDKCISLISNRALASQLSIFRQG